MKFLSTTLAPVGEAARAVEAVSAAEVVVVARRQSGSYRDIDLLVGITLSFLSLLAILFVEYEFPVWVVPFNLAATFALGTGLAHWLGLAGYLSPRQRRISQVKAAAREAFTRYGITHTRGRTGILVYWSVCERRIEVLFDLAVAKAIPETQRKAWIAALRKIESKTNPAAELAAHLNALTATLQDTLPVQEDDENELSDDIMVGDNFPGDEGDSY